MSEEAEYEQWLDAALAFEANLMSAEEEHEQWLDSTFALEANLMSAEEEHEQWLDSTLALEASLTSPCSALELPEEIPDNCDTWWPKSFYEEWSRLDASDSRARRRVLRLRGRREHERVHIHVRQKLWKGARAMASRFRRLYGACAPKRRHDV